MVVVTLGDFDPAKPVHGLLVDEWTEVVPAARQETGLTFEYDAPGATAPQAVLLAVPADGAPAWQPDALVQTLEEAFDLARARAADIDSLGAAGQFLPGTYVPVNLTEPQTSTDFVPDAPPPDGTAPAATLTAPSAAPSTPGGSDDRSRPPPGRREATTRPVDHHLEPTGAAHPRRGPQPRAGGPHRRPALVPRPAVAARRVPGRGRGQPRPRQARRRVRALHRGAVRARGGPAAPMPAARPLEAVVEAEDTGGAHDLRWAAEIGQELLRLLSEHGAGAVRAAVVARYPIPGPPADGPSAADETTAYYLRIMAGRAPHGTDVLRDYAKGAFPGSVNVPAELTASVTAAVTGWLDWLQVGERPSGTSDPGHLMRLPGVLAPAPGGAAQDPPWPPDGFLPLVDTPGPDVRTWQRERMEYAFAVAATGSGGETVLTAPEYGGDRLDWYHLDHDPDASLHAPSDTERRTRVVVPTRAAYPGMPATRFWEMEDADVNLGRIGAARPTWPGWSWWSTPPSTATTTSSSPWTCRAARSPGSARWSSPTASASARWCPRRAPAAAPARAGGCSGPRRPAANRRRRCSSCRRRRPRRCPRRPSRRCGSCATRPPTSPGPSSGRSPAPPASPSTGTARCRAPGCRPAPTSPDSPS
ncbi:hypothetical protein ACFQY7_04995 [Actinomadura luteofluorescens]|uniref:hypothetical protein n=1 Tax=Actinomadura luteofluorescens TaxID=46163 RepID=UPI003641A81D